MFLLTFRVQEEKKINLRNTNFNCILSFIIWILYKKKKKKKEDLYVETCLNLTSFGLVFVVGIDRY
jgi:hypothetical protein